MLTSNLNVRRLALTPRWAVAGLTKPQNVAEHSYYVAVYCMELARIEKLDDWDARALVELALLHDFPEYLTSDIPGPVKRTVADPDRVKQFESHIYRINGVSHPELFVSEKMMQLLKLANLIDEWWTLQLDVARGNSTILGFVKSVEDRMKLLCETGDFTESTRSEVYNVLNTSSFTFDRIDREYYVTATET